MFAIIYIYTLNLHFSKIYLMIFGVSKSQKSRGRLVAFFKDMNQSIRKYREDIFMPNANPKMAFSCCSVGVLYVVLASLTPENGACRF